MCYPSREAQMRELQREIEGYQQAETLLSKEMVDKPWYMGAALLEALNHISKLRTDTQKKWEALKIANHWLRRLR